MPEPSVNFLELTESYFHSLPVDEVNENSAQLNHAIASGHFRFGQQRNPGEDLIRVFTPDHESDKWENAQRIVVEIVCDDRQFLVNSINANLLDLGFTVTRLLHPIFIVDRNDSGKIETIDLHDFESHGEFNHLRESWIHVELAEQFSEAQAERIKTSLADVLNDVLIASEDWLLMVDQMKDVLSKLGAVPNRVNKWEVEETKDFLKWLIEDHYTFLGYREYVIVDQDGTHIMKALPETGLGALRAGRLIAQQAQNEAAAEAALLVTNPVLMVTKADTRSTVRRRKHFDRISIRTFDENGAVVGERRFLGLFSSNAYSESIRRIPILNSKAQSVLRELNYDPKSFNGKQVLEILEGFPRDELFSAEVKYLARIASELLHSTDGNKLQSFVRRDQLNRFLSILIYMPAESFNTKSQSQIDETLSKLSSNGVRLERSVWLDSNSMARLHIMVRPINQAQIDAIDEDELEHMLQQAIRTWADEFNHELKKHETVTGDRKRILEIADDLPEAYREDHLASAGLSDVIRLFDLKEDGISLSFRKEVGGNTRFTIYRRGQLITLAEILPIFTSLGVSVLDERPYELDATGYWIYDFGFTGQFDETRQTNFKDAFLACWRGEVEVDGYNELVTKANLPWRSVVLLRAYAKYLRQAGNPFSERFVQTTLIANQEVANLLIKLFDVMFNPKLDATLEQRAISRDQVLKQLSISIDGVTNRDADQLLRALLNLITATVRTNFYQLDEAGNFKTAVALKFEPERITNLPAPRPKFEIFCYSPRVEGVHLRFGLVARGGLRWSDRQEDFRTEVLGLVKAQMVKNSVIVPTGSKGGFFAKQLPDPSDREAWLAEGVGAYETFISALLDLTDNRTQSGIKPPSDVVRWDGDDSYLVVAADKGTAKFSDYANAISAKYGFWLGDAFASGGSAGYDHKSMGITARGAWESVKRHFADREIDCQTQDFTCVGIGDMSGDVFGNAMMLSEHIKLIAAFDHRHIFIDPNPDSKTSHTERVRLFNLPRSSWADYNPELISEGGGVFDRSLKQIPISPQMKQALGIEADSLTPPELISAALCAPVDLLFNGGIGTYVKASSETNADVGDKANDVLRVNGKDLRCSIIGEGGNLGMTQLGRIEYALNGGQLNTDFIDNSGGVDTSDHEVNIKILLESAIKSKTLDAAKRDELLASMTDEVAQLVLSHNVSQNTAMTTAVARSKFNLLAHWDLMRNLESSGRLNRALEFLPTDEEMERRRIEGIGLTSPELAVLLAYTKIDVADSLKEAGAAKDEFFNDLLVSYFPGPLQNRFAQEIQEHPLRDEIIVTRIVNQVVDAAGITFFQRLSTETGADVSMLARAHIVATRLLNANRLLDELDGEPRTLDATSRTRIRTKIREHVEQGARWLVNNTQGLNALEVEALLSKSVQEMLQVLPQAITGRVKERFDEEVALEMSAGLPKELAQLAAIVKPASAVFGLALLTKRLNMPAADVASIYFQLGERLGLDRLARQVDELVDDGRWEGMARSALADDVRSTQVALTQSIINSTAAEDFAEARVANWVEQRVEAIDGSLNILASMWSEGQLDLAKLTVSLQMAKRLINS